MTLLVWVGKEATLTGARVRPDPDGDEVGFGPLEFKVDDGCLAEMSRKIENT